MFLFFTGKFIEFKTINKARNVSIRSDKMHSIDYYLRYFQILKMLTTRVAKI